MRTAGAAPLILVFFRVFMTRLLPVVDRDRARYAVMIGLITYLSRAFYVARWASAFNTGTI